MQPIIKALAGALAAGVLATGALVLGPGVAGADTPGTPGVAGGLPVGPSGAPAPIDWKPCPDHRTAECGTLRLPIDWAHPAGETFDLAVARRKATDPDRRVGVLLVNPGGPGASGVGFALDDAPAQFSADIQARFDIVGFDPRGVGASQPVMCSSDLLGRAPSAYPRNETEFDRWPPTTVSCARTAGGTAARSSITPTRSASSGTWRPCAGHWANGGSTTSATPTAR
ncbi:hypothetical protein ABZ078_20295 [Streptomyces sp. NPDC006385]|uniref:hypothetical protein n=1 Tax=Streptomyces sp. NPDC006385 TaxID=3156761 RepID=UPI0033A322C4